MIRVVGFQSIDEAPPRPPGPPFPSPDGAHTLAFEGYRERQPGLVTHATATVARADGSRLVDFEGPFLEPVPYAPWSHDGRRIALVPWANRIEIIDIVRDARWHIPGVPMSVQWAPSADRLLITTTAEASLVDPDERTSVARVVRRPGRMRATWWGNRWMLIDGSAVEVLAGMTGESFGALDLDPMTVAPIDAELLVRIHRDRLGIKDRSGPRFQDPDRWLADLDIRPIDGRHLAIGVLRPTAEAIIEDDHGPYLPAARTWVSIATT